MGFLREQISKTVDNELSKNASRQENRHQMANALGDELRKQYFQQLEIFIDEAKTKSIEIEQQEIPTSTNEFIAFCQYCEKKANMPLTSAIHIAHNREAGIRSADFDVQQPSRIIKKAWEEKLNDVLDFGSTFLASNAEISQFLADRDQRKKEEKKKMIKKSLISLGVFLIVLLILIFIMISFS